MRKKVPILLLLAALAACATTPQQRELQYANAIADSNDATTQALDFGIIKADEAEAIQGITRVAAADLKRAVEMRRAGRETQAWDRIMDAIMDGLLEAARILEGREKGK